MEDRHQRLEEHCNALHSQAHPEAPSIVAVRGASLWVGTASYLGVTLDKRLKWSHIYQMRKKAAQRL
jgi:hypothetical protein